MTVANLPPLLLSNQMEDMPWQSIQNSLGPAAVSLYFSVFYIGQWYVFLTTYKAAAIAAFEADPDFNGWVSLNGNDYSRLALDTSIVPAGPTVFPPIDITAFWDVGIHIPGTNPAAPPQSDNYYSMYSLQSSSGLTFINDGTPVPGFACTIELIWTGSAAGFAYNWGGIKFPNGIQPVPSGGTSMAPVIDLMILQIDHLGNILGTYINNLA